MSTRLSADAKSNKTCCCWCISNATTVTGNVLFLLTKIYTKGRKNINKLKVSSQQQYVNVHVPVSMVEPRSGQQMLLANVQTNSVAWSQGGRQVALVPSWPQQAAPHSLIVDPTPFLNVEEIYPKHHLNLPRHEPKKESPMQSHHLL